MDLVIGGSGFIGSWLVSVLREMGRAVRVFDLASYPSDGTLRPNQIRIGSILDIDAVNRAVGGCETVYHLAGIAHLWKRNPADFDRVNHRGTKNVVEAVRRAGVNRFVYTSTESILIPRVQNGPITESVRTTLDEMIGPYCRSKFLAERQVMELAKSGFPAVIVNPTLPIGPLDRNLTPPGQMIRNFLLGRIKGYLECVLNFVDVRDVAMGHVLAFQYGVPGERYILAGHNILIKDFFMRLAEITNTPPPRFKAPTPIALGFSYFDELRARLTGKEPLSSVTGVRLCGRSMAFDGSQTWRRLGGHSLIPLERSLKDAVTWHRRRLEAEGFSLG